MPNFVPEGEDNTRSARPMGRHQPNFVPLVQGQLGQPSPGADAQFAEAVEARHKQRARAKQKMWDAAVEVPPKSTPSTFVAQLKSMPSAQRDLYLLAEEATLNRQDVLRWFPTVAPSARELWAEYATPQPSPTAKKGTQK